MAVPENRVDTDCGIKSVIEGKVQASRRLVWTFGLDGAVAGTLLAFYPLVTYGVAR
ncbi:MAG: hypothetical protein MPJ50_18150 [Pirellulales bacterium]|nr:hypothetical protein [Pirellulales bacterium]